MESRKTDDTITKNNTSSLFPPTLDSQPEATNAGTIIIKGIAQSGRTVLVKRNNVEVGKTLSGNDGVFFLGPIELKPGDNSIFALTWADKQESKESNTIHITYKKDPPKLDVTSPQPNSVYTGEDKEVRIEGNTDNDAILTINDRLVPVDGKGYFSLSYKLSDGDNKIKIVAKDTAGNEINQELTVKYRP